MMWLRRLTNYLLTHRLAAVVATILLTCFYAVPGGGVIASLSMIFAGLVTLVKGPKEGALYTIAATFPLVILGYLLGGTQNLLPTSFVGILIFSNLLTWILAWMLYNKATWSQVLQLAALIGVFAVSVLHLVYPGVTEWWSKQILQSLLEFKKVIIQYHWENTVSLPQDLPTVAAQSAQTASGFTAVFILVVNLLQLIIARWWQASVFQPGLLGFELRNIRLSQLAGLLFVVTLGVLYYYGNSVLTDVLPILVLLFVCAGLSLLHYFFSLMPRSPSTVFWLCLTYLVMFYTAGISMMFLVMLAIFDVWFDVRRRFKKV